MVSFPSALLQCRSTCLDVRNSVHLKHLDSGAVSDRMRGASTHAVCVCVCAAPPFRQEWGSQQQISSWSSLPYRRDF